MEKLYFVRRVRRVTLNERSFPRHQSGPTRNRTELKLAQSTLSAFTA